jgi:hypothetical protein
MFHSDMKLTVCEKHWNLNMLAKFVGLKLVCDNNMLAVIEF